MLFDEQVDRFVFRLAAVCVAVGPLVLGFAQRRPAFAEQIRNDHHRALRAAGRRDPADECQPGADRSHAGEARGRSGNALGARSRPAYRSCYFLLTVPQLRTGYDLRLPGGRMARRNRDINLPAPYLKRLWLDASRVGDREAYPFFLPFLHQAFSLSFDRAITTIVGENGTGKSTLLEGIAALAGYDGAGGGKGYRPLDHSDALEKMGGELSGARRASWLPKDP